MSIIDEWFASAVGTKMNPDGHYGLQCVDVIDHYAEYIFGVGWPVSVGGVNGAKNLLDVAPDEYWTRIDYYHGFIPEYGDVLVFEGDSYNQWGHTAVTLSANYTTITAVQQDGFAKPWIWADGAQYSDKPVHVYYLNYSQNGTGILAGVIRPKPSKLQSTINLASTGITREEDDELSAQFEIDVRNELAERKAADYEFQVDVRGELAAHRALLLADRDITKEELLEAIKDAVIKVKITTE